MQFLGIKKFPGILDFSWPPRRQYKILFFLSLDFLCKQINSNLIGMVEAL